MKKLFKSLQHSENKDYIYASIYHGNRWEATGTENPLFWATKSLVTAVVNKKLKDGLPNADKLDQIRSSY